MRTFNLIRFYKKINHIFSNNSVNKSFVPSSMVFLKKFSSSIPSSSDNSKDIPSINNIHFFNQWPINEQLQFTGDMIVYENFLTDSEEQYLIDEVDPYLKRMKYEFDHWDDAIHGFRETERKQWYPKNRLIVQKIADIAFNGKIMPYIHVLDLAADGVIKPHVDSSRYCGTTIAGVSLLSDSVMRLVRTDEKKYKQDSTTSGISDEYRNQSSSDLTLDTNFYADVLLKRKSLYIMKDTARYNFTHEILSNENSIFMNCKVVKERRVSIICRNEAFTE